MSSDSVCLTLTACFTALLGLTCLGTLIMPVTLELMVLLVLLATAHVKLAGVNPMDRTARVAGVVVAGMLLVALADVWRRGEQPSLMSGLLRTVGRFGLVAFLASWTALVSAGRSTGQYIYNLVFVSSFACLIGHVSTRLVLEPSPWGVPGAFAAWLEGGALGSAFAYVTLSLRETTKIEGSEGVASNGDPEGPSGGSES